MTADETREWDSSTRGLASIQLAACRLQIRCSLAALSAGTKSMMRAQLGGLVTLQAMAAMKSCPSVDAISRATLPGTAPISASQPRDALHAHSPPETRHNSRLNGLSAQSLRLGRPPAATPPALWVRAPPEPVSQAAYLSLLRHEHCVGISGPFDCRALPRYRMSPLHFRLRHAPLLS